MAIIKEMNTKFGVGASYHRITAFNISYSNKKITICVASYISKEARANMHDPIEEVDIEVPLSDYTLFVESNPMEQSYIWLKQNVIGFEDSEDDMDVIEKVVIESEDDELGQ
jgi:hypothetical protein